MTETVVTVRGSASTWFDPERATVSIAVSADGPKREPVFDAVTSNAAAITAELSRLHDAEAGPVTRWSSDRISVWSQRPWSNEGKQLPPVFHAALGVTARFRDFDALAAFIERFATVDGVTISAITWELTEATQREATADIRRRAVEDALAAATVYATAAGLTTVTPIAIAEPGMLGDAPAPIDGGLEVRQMAFKAGGAADLAGELSFTPDRIELSASVDARFRAN